MTIREGILTYLKAVGDFGITVADFLSCNPHLKPQSIYPVFTKLCQEGLIRDSCKRRRGEGQSRRCIVWWLAKYGGTIPVWGSGRPRYSYSNRAKIVLDTLVARGPQTAPELATHHSPLGTSSLMSSLAAQGWVRKTKERRTSPTSNRKCIVWDITALGRSVRRKGESK